MNEEPDREVEAALGEQLAYYRARASEYDEWFLRRGRYDRGAEANGRWFAEVEEVRVALDAILAGGDVLELACGTGLWTERLAAAAAQVTCVDASAEVLARNESRLVEAGHRDMVSYEVADLFAWKPSRRYSLVFFGFWLSHVPESRFERFFRLVAEALDVGGRVFFVDNRESSGAGRRVSRLLSQDTRLETRELNDGREFEIIKTFHEPARLQQRLSELGFRFDVRETATHFIYGIGERE